MADTLENIAQIAAEFERRAARESDSRKARLDAWAGRALFRIRSRARLTRLYATAAGIVALRLAIRLFTRIPARRINA